MKSTKQASWAIAASAMLAASTICGAQAQDRTAPGAGAQTPPAAQQSPADRVRDTAQSGAAGAAAAAQGQQQGQQVDQQLMQQYQQISSDPKMAPAKLWVLETALHNQAELQLSQQAQQKAKSDQVKQIAQRMVQDHQKMGQMLEPVAQQMNLQVPKSLPSLKQQQLQAMTSLEAEQFDKKYIAHLHMAHARDVASFQAASQMDQEQVKQFATQHLPMLQQHKQQVQQTAMAMNVIGQQSGEAQPAGSHVPGSTGSHTDAPRSGSGTDTPRIETPRSGSGAAGSGSPGGAAPSGSGTGTGAGSSGTSSGSGAGGTDRKSVV